MRSTSSTCTVGRQFERVESRSSILLRDQCIAQAEANLGTGEAISTDW